MNLLDQSFELIDAFGVFLMIGWILSGIRLAWMALVDHTNGVTKADRQRDQLARGRE